MEGMFSGCDSLINLDLSNFDTSNLRNMKYMFHECDNLASVDLSGFALTYNKLNLGVTDNYLLSDWRLRSR